MTMNCSNPFGQRVLLGRYSCIMRILITGGFGFVGGRVAVYLAQAGHTIVLGSRKAIGSPSWLPQAEVMQTDWDDMRTLERSCKGVDVVIHAAGMNAKNCASDPIAALAFNGVATARLVSAAIQAGVQRFIYLSTAHVYGSLLEGIISEEDCPQNFHPYATSHLAGEKVVLWAHQGGHLQGVVLRLSNLFGAPVHKDVNCWMLLVNDLCKQAVQTRRMVLHSTGLQHRDFMSMTNFCSVIDRFMSFSGDDSQLGIFNIGSGTSQAVLTISKFIQERCLAVLGFEPELHRKDELEGDLPSPFNYQITRQNKLGVNFDLFNNEAEIDKILAYCQAIFEQSRIYS